MSDSGIAAWAFRRTKIGKPSFLRQNRLMSATAPSRPTGQGVYKHMSKPTARIVLVSLVAVVLVVVVATVELVVVVGSVVLGVVVGAVVLVVVVGAVVLVVVVGAVVLVVVVVAGDETLTTPCIAAP